MTTIRPSEAQRATWLAASDDCLLAITDGHPIPTKALQALPPWRAVMLARVAAKAGAPVEFVVPEEGGLSFIYNTAIVNNRPQESMDLAHEFFNSTLDPERQIDFSRLTGYPPTNMEAMRNLPEDLAKLRMTEEEVAAFGKIQREFDYMAMFAYRDEIKTRWDKEVLAG